jgi:hypothetical protein
MTRPGNSKSRPGIRIQQRDLNLLGELGLVNWMSTSFIHTRHFPNDRTGEATRRRLRLHAANGLIESVDLHITTQPGTGRAPRFHRLLQYGAEVYEDLTGVRPARVSRSSLPKPHTIQHRAGMGETLLKFKDACKHAELPATEWILEYDALAGSPPGATFHERFVICHELADESGVKHRVWPDALSTLNVVTKDGVAQLAIAWEYDRGTEPHAQLRAKLDPYSLWIATSGYREHYPDARDIRVCFVLPSQRRLDNVIETLGDHPIANYLRFVSESDFTTDRILTAPIWHDTKGNTKPILPS